jgi:hypothetical protein
MNPVDHVSFLLKLFVLEPRSDIRSSLTVVVTTNISVKPLPSPVTPPKVKRPVLSLPAEQVCCVVPRTRINLFLEVVRTGTGFFYGLQENLFYYESIMYLDDCGQPPARPCRNQIMMAKSYFLSFVIV